MSLFEILLFVHIFAAMIWVGGALTGTLIGTFIGKSNDTAAMASFCKAFASIAGPLFGGSAMLVLASGIWMVADSPIEFSATWVVIGFVGWLVSTVMGATVVGMSWMKLGLALQEPGASLESMRPALGRAQMLTWIDLAIRTAVIVVMVWRPA